jgi:ubiquitin-activating enzyme E1
LNDFNGKEFQIEIDDAYQFKIGDISSYGTYTSNHSCGYGNQIFAPLNLTFQSFEESIKQPEIVIFDFGEDGRDQQVILAFLSLMKYLDVHSDLSSNISYDDLLQFAQEINSTHSLVEEIDENILKPFPQQTNAVISPLAAIYGGIVGQEILKAISIKFTPIFQFLCIGAIEALPKNPQVSLKYDRYDPYRRVFGNDQIEVIHKLRYFLLGAGALGCEFLKDWAMMGVATEGYGRIIVTDVDQIEKSNLTRGLLFRNKDID